MRTPIIAAIVSVTALVATAAAWTPSGVPADALAAVAPRAVGAEWIGDFDVAAAKAKKEGKDLFVDFTGSDWCGWCIKLHEEVFQHDEFLTAVQKNFVLVALDYPRSPEAKAKVPNPQRNQELSQKYGIEGFPTILLMTPDGEVFGRTGYAPGGPTPYVENVNGMLTKGKAEVAAAKKLVDSWTAATGEAKDAEWDKLATAAEGMEAGSVGLSKLVEPLRSAFTSDANNAKGRKLRATKLMLKMEMADEAVVAAALELDPKNEAGMHEQGIVALFTPSPAFEDADAVKRMLEALDKFDALGKIHDGEKVVIPFAYGAFLSRDALSDDARAKKYAQRAKAIGSSNQRLLDAMDEILGA